MSKRHVVGSSRSRKRRKGASYASVGLDQDEPSCEVELINVWDVGTSKRTGRISATQKTHRHVNEGAARPMPEEPNPAIEDVGILADHELSGQPPTKSTKHKKVKATKQKAAKQNDSVSSAPMPSSELIFTR